MAILLRSLLLFDAPRQFSRVSGSRARATPSNARTVIMSKKNRSAEAKSAEMDFSKLPNWDNFADVGFSGDEVPADLLEDFEALSLEVNGASAASPLQPKPSRRSGGNGSSAPPRGAKEARMTLEEIQRLGSGEADVTVDDDDEYDAAYEAELAELVGEEGVLDAEVPERGSGKSGAEERSVAWLHAEEPDVVGGDLDVSLPQQRVPDPHLPAGEATVKRSRQEEVEEPDFLTGLDDGAAMAQRDNLEEVEEHDLLTGLDDGLSAEGQEGGEPQELASGVDDGAPAEPAALDLKSESQKQITAIEERIVAEKQRWLRAKKEGRQEEQTAAMRIVKVLKVDLANQKRIHALSEKGMSVKPLAPPSVMRQRSGGPTGSGSTRAKRKQGTHISSPTAQASDQDHLSSLPEQLDLEAKILKIKKEALRHHKAGRSEKAKALLLQAKELESSQNRPSAGASAAAQSSGPAPARAPAKGPDAFSPLEDAIREAIRRYVARAREMVGVEKRLAHQHLELAKEAKQLLEELQLRRSVPHAVPPLFRWTTDIHHVNKKIQTLGMEEVEISIRGVRNVPLMLSEGKSSEVDPKERTNVVVRFDLAIPRDNPVTGAIELPAIQAGTGDVELQGSGKFAIKRGRSLQIEVKRRKATFEIWQKKGWFRADVLLGTAVIPLAELLGKCEVGGWIDLNIRDTRRKSGAAMSIVIRQHEPLRGQEVEEIRVQRLTVDPWPAPGSRPPEPVEAVRPSETTTTVAQAVSESDSTQAPQTARTTQTAKPAGEPQMPRRSPNAANEDLGAGLSDVHKRTPLSPNCIVSNHVLEYELGLVDQRIAKEGAGNEVPLDLTIRKQHIEAQIQNLINSIQAGNLTQEGYISNVKLALAADSRLVLWLRSRNRNAEALQVKKRVELMKEELADAEESMAS